MRAARLTFVAGLVIGFAIALAACGSHSPDAWSGQSRPLASVIVRRTPAKVLRLRAKEDRRASGGSPHVSREHQVRKGAQQRQGGGVGPKTPKGPASGAWTGAQPATRGSRDRLDHRSQVGRSVRGWGALAVLQRRRRSSDELSARARTDIAKFPLSLTEGKTINASTARRVVSSGDLAWLLTNEHGTACLLQQVSVPAGRIGENLACLSAARVLAGWLISSISDTPGAVGTMVQGSCRMASRKSA
jgi:hypothetical protein